MTSLNYLYISVLIFSYLLDGITAWIIPNIQDNENNGNIAGIDSDYFLLYLDSSTLPSRRTDGVFARYFIPKGSVICEYRGPIIAAKDKPTYYKVNPNSMILAMEGPDGLPYMIIGRGICANICDCTSIITNKSYEKDEVFELDRVGNKCFDGYNHNAKKEFLLTSGND